MWNIDQENELKAASVLLIKASRRVESAIECDGSCPYQRSLCEEARQLAQAAVNLLSSAEMWK